MTSKKTKAKPRARTIMPCYPYSDYQWIDDDPLPEEIDTNADGSEFLPIFQVETKLRKLDSHWGDERFVHRLFIAASGDMFADGSLELVVNYGGRTRRLAGAATILIPSNTNFDNPDVNTNYGATIKSECIKNAAKGIGPNFGSRLNSRDVVYNPSTKVKKVGGKPPAVEMIAPPNMQDKYNTAVEAANQSMMTVIRATYPGIKYTGTKKINHAIS